MTDCAWAIEVASTHGIDNDWTKRAGLAVLLPYTVNVVCFFAILSYLRCNPTKVQHMQSDAWIQRYWWKMMIVILVTGNGEPVLQLFNSKIFGLNAFSMNLRYKTLQYHAKWVAIALNCFLEKFPQFGIQLWYIMANTTSYGQFAVVAIIFSFIGVVLTLLHILGLLCIKQFESKRIQIIFKFKEPRGGDCSPSGHASDHDFETDIDDSKSNATSESKKAHRDDYKYLKHSIEHYESVVKNVFGRRVRIKKLISKNIGIPSNLLLCQYVDFDGLIDSEIRMVLEVLRDNSIDKDNKLNEDRLNQNLTKSKSLRNGVNTWLNDAYDYKYGRKNKYLKVQKVDAVIWDDLGNQSVKTNTSKISASNKNNSDDIDRDAYVNTDVNFQNMSAEIQLQAANHKESENVENINLNANSNNNNKLTTDSMHSRTPSSRENTPGAGERNDHPSSERIDAIDVIRNMNLGGGFTDAIDIAATNVIRKVSGAADFAE